MTTLKSVVGIPKDSERLAVDASEIDAWSNIFSEKLMGLSLLVSKHSLLLRA
jgi:hypothetical protein